MYDFSAYGGASPEFTALMATFPPQVEQTATELQATVNRVREEASEQEMRVLSAKVLIEDHTIPSPDGHELEARTYRPASLSNDEKLPIYIHFHGGGFLFGTLDSENATCSRIADATGVVVLNVCYRHTPDWVYPAAWLDAEEAFDWAVDNAASFGGDPEQIVVGGISAGGHLSASLAQTLTREGKSGPLKGQVLMIPVTVLGNAEQALMDRMDNPSCSSFVQNENAPILSMSRMRMFTELLCPKPTLNEDRRANPGLATAEEISSLPPTTIGVCGLDPVRDEGLLYAQLLAENGVALNVHLFKGVPHGFRRFGDKLSLSEDWDKVMHDGIRWALSHPEAGGVVDLHVHS